ncbi:hypothetical protein CAC42_5911 [Sphaceloma murrayae]|uniref:Uncharacterized protein n=1 Tax=Sphaceloma murrayae TaxID=2082308 RepID=A0A2K1QZJ3_9PEZI|nr:hypothetical protein CAC42_5911 [Sphaceloma murrayae]
MSALGQVITQTQPTSWGSNLTQTLNVTLAPSPTFTLPVRSCELYLEPAWAIWTTPTSFPFIGTTYMYVDPNVNTTSTSVTCTPSLLPVIRGQQGAALGNLINASMSDNCDLYVTYWGPRDRSTTMTSAKWPGPSTVLDVGPDISILYYLGSDHVETVTAYQTVLPPVPHYYTGDVFTTFVTRDSGVVSKAWEMPALSLMYPELPDLESCTPIFFETSPNTLTYAQFLTQISTLPRSAAATPTSVQPIQQGNPSPQPNQAQSTPAGPTPTPVSPAVPITNPGVGSASNSDGAAQAGTPAQDTAGSSPDVGNSGGASGHSGSGNSDGTTSNSGAGNSGGVANNVGTGSAGTSSNSGTGSSGGATNNVGAGSNANSGGVASNVGTGSNANSGGVTSNVGTGNNANSGGEPASAGSSNLKGDSQDAAAAAQSPATTVPALILPDRNTLLAGSPASTVSGHVISLNSQGIVFVQPTPTAGQPSPSLDMGKAVTLEQIAREGGINVDGTRIAAFGTKVVQQGSGSVGSSSSTVVSSPGGSGSKSSAAESVGSAVSSLGAWILSGLGGASGKGASSAGAASSSSSGGAADAGSSKGGNAASKGQNGGTGRNSTVVPFTGGAAQASGPMLGFAGSGLLLIFVLFAI